MPNISMTHPTNTATVKDLDMYKVILDLKEEILQKSVMSCPVCTSIAIKIVGRCATCKVCGWSFCSA